MRILLIDDTAQKLGRLKAALAEALGVAGARDPRGA